MKTLVDLERVRIKIEVARMRASDPVRAIPSGRVFDSLPGGASDAIDRKTANAELRPGGVERIRSTSYDTEDDEPLIKKSSKAPSVVKLELLEKTKQSAKASRREIGAMLATPPGVKVLLSLRLYPLPCGFSIAH